MSIPRLVRTVAHLKPGQVINRLRRRFVSLKRGDFSGIQRAALKGVWRPAPDRPVSILPDHQFVFLNETREVSAAGDWNDPGVPKLWLYNLHYHDGLMCPQTDPALKSAFLEKWVDENPAFAGNAWEPYPLSLRIVNWIKWDLSGGAFLPGMDAHLALQCAALDAQLEYHLLGNHLFANAKALVFAGFFFTGPEAERWLDTGLSILRCELPEQFLPDGGHFELSTTYQATLSEDLLDLVNMFQAFGRSAPEPLVRAAGRALNWLAVMTRPDGLPPLFNDAAYAISPGLASLQTYAARLGVPGHDAVGLGLVDLPHSGYFRFTAPNYSFWGDAGQVGPDYIPGHAHCDMLNFELFAHYQPVVVDTGTSTYAVGARRHAERSTCAHNTVQLGGHEQSEIWGGFRVGRRARITTRDVGGTTVRASHDGYRQQGIRHERQFEFGERLVKLVDTLHGRHSGGAVARFHLHPSITPLIEGGTVMAGQVRFQFSGAEKVELSRYEYAPEFNRRTPASCIEVFFTNTLTTDIQI